MSYVIMQSRRKCTFSKIPHLWFKYNETKIDDVALCNKIHDCILILFFHISFVLHALIKFIKERDP